MTEAITKEGNNRFPALIEKNKKIDPLGVKKKNKVLSLDTDAKKYRGMINTFTVMAKVSKAQLKFMKALEAELAAKNK